MARGAIRQAKQANVTMPGRMRLGLGSSFAGADDGVPLTKSVR